MNKKNIKQKEKKEEEKLKKKFQDLSKQKAPKSNIVGDCIRAFIVGGIICDIGQFFNNFYANFGYSKQDSGTLTAITLIFIGALLTGVGVYDKIGDFAGAGSVVPITGFANSVVAPAIEFKKEGFVFGVGGKMFTIAGPVLVYGIGSSVIVGIIYYFFFI